MQVSHLERKEQCLSESLLNSCIFQLLIVSLWTHSLSIPSFFSLELKLPRALLENVNAPLFSAWFAKGKNKRDPLLQEGYPQTQNPLICIHCIAFSLWLTPPHPGCYWLLHPAPVGPAGWRTWGRRQYVWFRFQLGQQKNLAWDMLVHFCTAGEIWYPSITHTQPSSSPASPVCCCIQVPWYTTRTSSSVCVYPKGCCSAHLYLICKCDKTPQFAQLWWFLRSDLTTMQP